MGRKVVMYIAMSLDGFIAGDNDSLEFLTTVESPTEDYGYEDFIKTIDTVIMGRKTYDKVLSFGVDFPHKGRETFVLSHSRTGSDENVHYFNGEIRTLISDLKSKEGKNIFLDGGAEVVNALMKEQLIDRYIISVIPYLLGSGVKLFTDGRPEHELKLLRCITFPSELVQLWYEKKR